MVQYTWSGINGSVYIVRYITTEILSLKSACRRLERTYIASHSMFYLKLLRSSTNRYHKCIAAAKKSFYASLVQSSFKLRALLVRDPSSENKCKDGIALCPFVCVDYTPIGCTECIFEGCHLGTVEHFQWGLVRISVLFSCILRKSTAHINLCFFPFFNICKVFFFCKNASAVITLSSVIIPKDDGYMLFH